jgi:hypothetical protein
MAQYANSTGRIHEGNDALRCERAILGNPPAGQMNQAWAARHGDDADSHIACRCYRGQMWPVYVE